MAETPEPYVITCGDEGVQINTGTRISFAGCGYGLEGFAEAVKVLKKIIDPKLRIASNQENDWIKDKLDLSSWEQVNASAQQHVEALADEHDLLYSGYLPFTDPRKLKHGIKGHMVRPKQIHVANKICFTLGGGEQVYNLGCYRISADWAGSVPKKTAEKLIKPQIKFYEKLFGKKMPLFYELGGILDEKLVDKNLKMLQKLGLKVEELPERG